jgi:membrane-bound ClpP family serine protease
MPLLIIDPIMTVVILLILLGILLFVIEFFLIPGVTIAGIGGLILTVFGVYKAFNDFGSTTGVWVLIGTLLASVFVIAMSLRARTWNRLMLKTDIKGTVDTAPTEDQIKAGDGGTTLTRLAPMGKILVNDQVREATSTEGFVDPHTNIKVVSVEGTRISVKPIKEK